jgi:hypothetical protein
MNTTIHKLIYRKIKTELRKGGNKFAKKITKTKNELTKLPIIKSGPDAGNVLHNQYLEFPKETIFPSHMKHGRQIYKPSIWNTDGKQFVKFVKQ